MTQDSNAPFASTPAPRLTSVQPIAALPGGDLWVHGSDLQAVQGHLPVAMLGDLAAHVLMSRPERLVLRVPEEAEPGLLRILRNGEQSNGVSIEIAQLLANGIHQVTNPVIDREGNVYATFSGPRGQDVPVSLFKITPSGEATQFLTGIRNATGLAIGPDGVLYVSSRQDGTIYSVTPDGRSTVYEEGLGIATGIAFDAEQNLYVGDRSGTIFKISPDHKTFVFATMEPSVSAYHLAFGLDGTLFVAGPTTSSHDAVYAIGPDGTPAVHYRGIGRPQGIALDIAGNVYVGGSLRGRRGIVQVSLDGTAELVASGAGVVGLAFFPAGDAVVATSNTLFTLPLGVEGLQIF